MCAPNDTRQRPVMRVLCRHWRSIPAQKSKVVYAACPGKAAINYIIVTKHATCIVTVSDISDIVQPIPAQNQIVTKHAS